MATRYWVGGAGNWSSTTKWSTTSGGTSGASVPTSVDDVIFDANSGGKFTATVDTAQTCASLSITPSSGAGVLQIAITSSLTVTGAFSTSGTAGNNRIWIRGTTYGVRTNIVCNGTVSISDCDFRDIIVNGTAAPISGTRIGNRGACAGITFSTPKTVYWRGNTGNWSSNGWAATPSSSVSTDSFPLPQDTAAFVDAAFAGGTITLDAAVAYTGSVDMSGRTSAMTIASSSGYAVYGSWANGSGTTISGTGGITFQGEGTKTITSAGKTFTCSIGIDCFGGSVLVNDALVCTGGSFEVVRGTFDTQGYSCQWGNFEFWNTAGIKFVYFRNSTITSTGSYPFGSSTNGSALADFMTLDAGTSTYNCSVGATAFYGFNKTFYNLSMPSGTINNGFTCNNLTFTAPGTGISTVSIGADITVNGTLSCAGASPTSRRFLRSGTLGTTRTITANAISANDCDFRDITIAGSAAGASPTRAGDCGGNSGINFPAPKTVYRVGTSTGWGGGGTAWALSSGGAPSDDNFPLSQDTAVFDNVASTGTLSITTTFNIGSIDCSTRTTGITLSFSATQNIYGNFTLGSGVTISGTGTQTFAGRGTQTFTSAGKTITFPITVGSFSGTFQLGDALNCSGTLTLTSGTFDAVSYNVTINNYLGQSGGHTLRMGSGLWTLTGTGSTWNATGLTNFFKGTADILLSNNTTTTRDFAGFGLSYNKLTIGGTTGTSTTTITGNNQFTELASTKTVAHTINLGGTIQTFGAWTVTGTTGNVVTLTGTGTGHILAGSATSGIDYLAMGSIGFSTGSFAEFYAGANSTGTATAPVYRTATPASRTLYWVGGTGNWSDTTKWSLSSGGAGGQAIPTSLDNVIFDSASNATAYTVTIDAISRCNQLTISAPASGNITLAGSSPLGIHGNVTLPATGLTRTYTGAISLTGSTTGKTFTTNGVTLASAITINGVGCGWTLGSALNISTATFTTTNGSFDTGSFSLTCGNLSSDNANDRAITLGSSNVTCSQVLFNTSRNLTFNAGTSTINLTGNQNYSINGGTGQTFYDIVATQVLVSGTKTILGNNTFRNITFGANGGVGNGSVLITGTQTVTGDIIRTSSNPSSRYALASSTYGTPVTISSASISLVNVDFRDINLTGAAAGSSPTGAGDLGGNSGIVFPAPKTVYRVGTGVEWDSSNSWALASGGTGANANFPLAQDTAVIDNATTLSGTLNLAHSSFFYTHRICALDFSSRTNAITLAVNGNSPIYGSVTLGSGVTVSGTSALTFSSRGTMTFTSAGKTITFPITVDALTGTFQLGDAFNSSNTLTLTSGTLNAVTYNVTATTYNASANATKTLNMGSGLWTLSGTGTVMNAGTVGSNTTVIKGTADILLSNTTTSSRTFTGDGQSFNKLTIGGATGVSTLTLSGNNTFTEIASTKTVAHTIALGTTSQRVGAFTVTGTAGNVVTITGNTSNLIYTGGSNITGLDYLNVQGRVYGSAGQITDVWYAGDNSVNSGSLGWVFAAGVTPPPSANANFFLMFG